MRAAERGMSPVIAQEMARREAITSSLGVPLAQAIQEVSTSEEYRGVMVGFHAAFRYAIDHGNPWFRTRYVDIKSGGIHTAVQDALIHFPPEPKARERYTQRAEVAEFAPIPDPNAHAEFTRGVAESVPKVTDHEVAMLSFADRLKYRQGGQLAYPAVRDSLVDAIRMYVGNTYETAHLDPY